MTAPARTARLRLPDDPADARRGVRRRAAWPLLLACLYAPYAWILLIKYPWNGYRFFWLKLWPILPGLIPSLFMTGPRRYRYAAMAAVTLAALAVLALHHRRPQPVGEVVRVALAVLAFSAFNAWVAYIVFRN